MLSKFTARLLIAVVIATSTSVGMLSRASLSALAFNCGSGYSNQQKDVFNNPQAGYYWHGWLGLCDGGPVYYYAGEDSRWAWGGAYHPISNLSIHLRAWSCGNLYYDSTTSNSGQPIIQLVSNAQVTCLYQADATGYMQDNGGPSWTWYLNY
jgi:hypothetical protein